MFGYNEDFMMNKNIKNIIAICLFGVLMSLETVAEYHSNGTPKIVKTYKIQSNKLILDKEQEFYSNGVIKFETKYRNGEAHSFNSWDKTGKPFKINLREYYFPIDKFIDNPQVYIYEDWSRRIKDIIKCETLIDGNRDTIFTLTFYSDLNSPGFEWKEKCTSKGILNMSSPEYKMINSPLFNYEQDLGDKSQASYFIDGREIYWERTLWDTVSWRNNENLIYYLENVPESLYKDIQELDLVVYSDSFKENNETIDHWGRDLFYSKGIGRVAVEYYNGPRIYG